MTKRDDDDDPSDSGSRLERLEQNVTKILVNTATLKAKVDLLSRIVFGACGAILLAAVVAFSKLVMK